MKRRAKSHALALQGRSRQRTFLYKKKVYSKSDAFYRKLNTQIFPQRSFPLASQKGGCLLRGKVWAEGAADITKLSANIILHWQHMAIIIERDETVKRQRMNSPISIGSDGGIMFTYFKYSHTYVLPSILSEKMKSLRTCDNKTKSSSVEPIASTQSLLIVSLTSIL